MRVPPQAAMLPGGRLHLQQGPIDLVVLAEGDPAVVQRAYAAVSTWFATVLGDLCEELDALRSASLPGRPILHGAVARRMEAAVMPFAGATFITPMAAVAGAVADAALATMRQVGPLQRAFVNNGGDIALHVAADEQLSAGLVDRPDRPGLFGKIIITAGNGLGGIATSGWQGRSFSLGIADAVTICATTAARADAAATIVANAVDLPGHPAVQRVAANSLQAESDLGDRLVTRAVGPLAPAEIAQALDTGARMAEALIAKGLIMAAALHCQGTTRIARDKMGLLRAG
jgi:ApbE superfamily uncharacterized protein (UPF0280 family)